jgi:hypothetical protein
LALLQGIAITGNIQLDELEVVRHHQTKERDIGLSVHFGNSKESFERESMAQGPQRDEKESIEVLRTS